MIVRLINKIKQISIQKKLKGKIHTLGKNCYIGEYYCIEGKKLKIESNCTIADGAWIKVSQATGNNAELIIEEGCNIGRFNEIYATKSIVIERKVLTAERVYISDNLHGYHDVNIPIIDQPLVQNKSVRIGEGSWIGVGVAILGASIGKHCVIGANAVVTHDIPDFSVAVGIPAKVIKRYNLLSGDWEKTNPDGTFINN